MTRNARIAIFSLVLLLLPGCLSTMVDDVNDAVPDDIWEMPGEDQWPRLNLGERMRTSPTLETYSGCDTLLEDLKDALWEQTLVEIDQNAYWQWSPNAWWGGGWMEDDVMVDASMDGDAGSADGASPPSMPSSGEENRDGTYSETNNQESGVDEADFLKFDGNHFYMINNDHLVIIAVPQHGEVVLTADLELEGRPMQMMKDGDSLVIISSINAWNIPADDDLRPLLVTDDGGWRSQSLVKYTVIDISNRSDPQIGRELFLEGNHQTARMVNGTVRSVAHMWSYIPGVQTWVSLPSAYHETSVWEDRMDIWNASVEDLLVTNRVVIDGLSLADFAPQMHERAADGTLTTYSSASGDCSEFSGSLDGVGRGFTSILTIDLLSEDFSHEVDHIASSWVHVYASGDQLILAEPANDWWWFWRNDGYDDATNIHTFDISTVGETTYIGSGRVNGTVQDQFSMSEYEGDVRIASTTDAWGRWWLNGNEWEVIEPANHVTVLRDDGEGTLETIGHLGDIAPGERIWSARFVADKAYLVTFRNMDPLWTIDLSDSTNPTVMGELEVPGVSTYIHPLSTGDLLTIGMPGGEDGLGLDWSHTQISLFNLSNFSAPTLADTASLTPAYTDDQCNAGYCGWSWSWSEATYEHKAFTYWEPAGLLAVPLSTYRYTYDEVTIDGRLYTHYGYEYVSKLVLIEVDLENRTLEVRGEVDHSEFYNGDGLSGWWSGDTSVRRSVFMGDYVYAFSGAGVSVTSYEDMNTTMTLELPGYETPNPYGYYEDEGEAVADEGNSSEEEPEEDVDSPEEG